jgi:hypothetical protein
MGRSTVLVVEAFKNVAVSVDLPHIVTISHYMNDATAAPRTACVVMSWNGLNIQ